MLFKVSKVIIPYPSCCILVGAMARGQQKLQSQAKAAEKAAKAKKQQGHNANSQKKAAQQALVFSCSVCKVCSGPISEIVTASNLDHALTLFLSVVLIFLDVIIFRPRCQTQRLTSNTSKTNIRKTTCLLNCYRLEKAIPFFQLNVICEGGKRLSGFLF